jgi:quercetin dioxygenase-like cupin family protein
MKKYLLCVFGIAVAFSLSNVSLAASDTIAIQQVDDLKWQDAAGMPGIKYAVVAGNPREAGLYVVRVKFSPGSMSRPHWHPDTRYVTVMKGTWWAGEGETFDPEKTTRIAAGGFAVHTAGKVHYDGAKDEEVIVQISGIGPSATNPVNPAPDAK